MLYHLFEYLNELDVPGAGLYKYISFRAGVTAILSLLISIVFGKRLIEYLIKAQMGEQIRNLGLAGQSEKNGTPTMGGIIIIAAIVIPTILFANLKNIYTILLLITTLWMGTIGFVDDYLKIKKKNSKGLTGKFKILGQVGLGFLIGIVLVFHEDIVIRDFTGDTFNDKNSLLTTIPFVKNNQFNYEWLMPEFLQEYTWILYIFIVIFLVTAISNGTNLTDGLDGLATGICAIVGLTLAVLAYLSGNVIYSDYLNIMFIPNSGELVIFCIAFFGACIGFLWYNTYPAQVFMGDTGSLSLGAIIAVLAFVIRKEFLIPILCGVMIVENLSVIIQVFYFKYSKKRFGEGRRVFLMAPLHHHFQKKEIHEAKIVSRFWIVGILLAVLTLVTLKIR